jgi:hypothetical protein
MEMGRTVRDIHSKPPGILDQLERGESLSPLDKLMFRERVDDSWKPQLSITEYSVISYIVRRTVHFGEISFTASTQNILNGANGWPGVGVSRRAYFTAMKSLEAMCMIFRQHHSNQRCTVCINTEWTPEDYGIVPIHRGMKGNKAADAGPLNEPNQSHGETEPVQQSHYAGAGDAPNWCARSTLNIYSKNTFNRNRGGAGEADAIAPSSRLPMPKSKTEKKPTSPDEKTETEFFGVAKEFETSKPDIVQPVAISVRQRISRAQAEVREEPHQQPEAARTATAPPLVTPMLMQTESWEEGRARILAERAAAAQVSPAGAATAGRHGSVKQPAPYLQPHRRSPAAGNPKRTVEASGLLIPALR